MIYHIWFERNARFHCQNFRSANTIIVSLCSLRKLAVDGELLSVAENFFELY